MSIHQQAVPAEPAGKHCRAASMRRRDNGAIG
jgi:hypothetical protein